MVTSRRLVFTLDVISLWDIKWIKKEYPKMLITQSGKFDEKYPEEVNKYMLKNKKYLLNDVWFDTIECNLTKEEIYELIEQF